MASVRQIVWGSLGAFLVLGVGTAVLFKPEPPPMPEAKDAEVAPSLARATLPGASVEAIAKDLAKHGIVLAALAPIEGQRRLYGENTSAFRLAELRGGDGDRVEEVSFIFGAHKDIPDAVLESKALLAVLIADTGWSGMEALSWAMQHLESGGEIVRGGVRYKVGPRPDGQGFYALSITPGH